MYQFEVIKQARTTDDLAAALGYTTKSLLYIAYGMPQTDKYHVFDVPKKAGGTRTILSPHEKLKRLQSTITNVFTVAIALLGDSYFPKSTHGFIPGRSIASNASPHKSRRYVVNIDLVDFLGSINFGRVRGILTTGSRFLFHEKIATILAKIICYNDSLPQGSPCSPIMSNIVARPLALRMIALAQNYQMRYTRYADDITLSTNQKN